MNRIQYYQWVSVKELGAYFDINYNEAIELLQLLGLRWKDENGNVCLRHGIFTEGVAKTISDKVQWNKPAIRAMVYERYPEEGWNSYVEYCDYEETARLERARLSSPVNMIAQLRAGAKLEDFIIAHEKD